MRRAAIALILLLAAPAAAQPVSLDARTAQAIITGCAAHASSKMQSEAIAVVDSGGHLVAALRMDGNASGIMDFAQAKAEAAAAWGFSTAQMADAAKGTPGFAQAPHVVTVPGGVPIWSADGKARIGAVGVSGEEPADDAECAETGVRPRDCARAILDPHGCSSIGGGCRKFIRTLRMRSKDCCSTA